MAVETLAVGQVVRVADEAVASGRSFDFGEVHHVNPDGTYGVLWGKAGCACMGIPDERADQLTLATTEEWDDYYAGKFPIPNGPDGKPAEEAFKPLFESDANYSGYDPEEDDDDDEWDDYEDDEEEEDYESDDEFPLERYAESASF